MPSVLRYRVAWTGFSGQPGVSTFYAESGGGEQAFANNVHAFLDAATLGPTTHVVLPTGVKLTFDAFVDEIDVASGDQTSAMAVIPPVQIVGTGTDPYAAVAGIAVTWITDGFVNGHRVKGRTYLVPINGGSQQTDGTLNDTVRSAVISAGVAYAATTPKPVVYVHRAKAPATPGTFAILAPSVKDKVAILTSRRD